MGAPRLAGLLAAPRAAHPYPLDHVLNAAGNRVIGSKVEKGEISNARYCGGLATRVVNRVAPCWGMDAIWQRANPPRIKKPGMLLGRS